MNSPKDIGEFKYLVHSTFPINRKPTTVSNRNNSQDHQVYKHRLTQSQEKSFSCSVCNSLFSRKSNLQRHVLTHVGVKPYACSYCSSLFSQKWHLHSHMLTHGGIKPFSCPDCKCHLLRSHIYRPIF